MCRIHSVHQGLQEHLPDLVVFLLDKWVLWANKHLDPQVDLLVNKEGDHLAHLQLPQLLPMVVHQLALGVDLLFPLVVQGQECMEKGLHHILVLLQVGMVVLHLLALLLLHMVALLPQVLLLVGMVVLHCLVLLQEGMVVLHPLLDLQGVLDPTLRDHLWGGIVVLRHLALLLQVAWGFPHEDHCLPRVGMAG